MGDSKVAILSGIRVLDMGRVLAAPLATQALADMGAEVLKIERPYVGSDERRYGPHFLKDAEGRRTLESAFHFAGNRGKKSVAIDIGVEEGRNLVRQLAKRVDVFVENFIPGKAKRLGLGFEELSRDNPRLIYCSISGYGHTGPYSDRPGYDPIFQAQSGLMSVTGIPDGEPGGMPMRTGPSLVDVATGQNAALAIVSALYYRDTVSGRGQHIDLALFDTAIAMQSHLVADYLISGEQPARRGTGGFGGYPANAFRCLDGLLYVSAGQDTFFRDLCMVLGCPEIVDDPRFATITMRGDYRDEIDKVILPLFARRMKQELMEELIRVRVPCTTIKEYREVFTDPHVIERGVAVEIPHPIAASGKLTTVANPIRFSETPIVHDRGWPLLAEHTESVLKDVMGFDPEEIAILRKNGVISS